MQNITTQQLINEGYFEVPMDFWADIAAGDKIRYTMTGRPGLTYGGVVGFVLVSDAGRKFRMKSEKLSGPEFMHATSDMETIWKKYPQGSSVELKLIALSLMEKKKAIETLEKRVETLEKELRSRAGSK